MVLNEKATNLMVVNGQTGEILGFHSIPLFRKEDLSLAYLVVCADEDPKGEQGQYLVNYSDIIYINEKHAIAVRACVEDSQGEELSLDEYTELIGLPVRYDDGMPIGRLTELSYNTETGAFDLALVESDKRTMELLRRQIDCANNIEIIVKRRLERPVEKTQPSRVWFRRLVADRPIVEEPVAEEPAFGEPVIETPTFEATVPEPEKTPEEIVADENARAIESLDSLLREMEGFAQPEAPAEAETSAAGLFVAEPEPPKDLFVDLGEKEPADEPQPEEPIELNEKFEFKPEGAAPEQNAPENSVENIPLFQQKFGGDEEETAQNEQDEQAKKKAKKEKGGARSLWKFGS